MSMISANTAILFEDKLDISVHPNPSNGILELSFNNHYIKNITIYNSVGQLAINTIYLEKNMDKYELDLEKMQSGLYFITIETKNETKIIKILKND